MTRSPGANLDGAKRRPRRGESRDRTSKASRATSALLVGVLWTAVLASAVGAVYCKYRARRLFIRLEQLSSQRDNLDIQWGQLQLEQSAWSTHALIESVAGRKLHMRMPAPRDIVIVRP